MEDGRRHEAKGRTTPARLTPIDSGKLIDSDVLAEEICLQTVEEVTVGDGRRHQAKGRTGGLFLMSEVPL